MEGVCFIHTSGLNKRGGDCFLPLVSSFFVLRKCVHMRAFAPNVNRPSKPPHVPVSHGAYDQKPPASPAFDDWVRRGRGDAGFLGERRPHVGCQLV